MRDINKILSELLGEKDERNQIEVGEIPQYLVDKVGENTREIKKLERERDLAEMQVKLDFQRKLSDMELQEKHSSIWGEIYKALNIPIDKQKNNFTVNKLTRKVYMSDKD